MKLNITNSILTMKPFKLVAAAAFLSSTANRCSTETELATQNVIDTIDSK